MLLNLFASCRSTSRDYNNRKSTTHYRCIQFQTLSGSVTFLHKLLNILLYNEAMNIIIKYIVKTNFYLLKNQFYLTQLNTKTFP